MTETFFTVESQSQELWKPIIGYEGSYEISSLGRVRSYRKNNSYRIKPVIRKQRLFGTGYWYVGLSKNSCVKWRVVHRLVALHFVENPLELAQVHHLNFDCDDNRACNLRWVTAEENISHSQERNRAGAKLTPSQAKEIFKRFYTEIISVIQLANEYGVVKETVGKIISRRTWKSETEDLKYLALPKEKSVSFANGEVEVWREVIGYKGLYEVSSRGRVKSLARERNCSMHGDAEFNLTLGTNHSGYRTVNLTNAGGSRSYQVHRLIAAAFLPNPLGLPYVHHINADRADNRVENLEWCNASYNNANRKRFVAKKTRCKLTEEDIHVIRALHATGDVGYRTIAERYDVHWDTIRKIVKRKLWADV